MIVSSYSDITQRVAAAVSPPGAEAVPLLSCTGRVLAQDVVSADNVPPFDKSPFDGYAFRAADSAGASRETPVTLRILEEIAAGSVPHATVTPGTAVKILTGAPVPPGADAVTPFEYTSFTADTVTLFAPSLPGSNVITAGEDIRKGDLLVRAGTRIDAGVLASLAAQNITAPEVYRVPRIGILSTGSELTDVGTPLAPGKIYDSNGYSLTAVVRQLGAEPVYYGNVKDDVSTICAAMERALSECDVLITTGGVSVGDYDLVPAALQALGAELFCRKVDVKPGMACCYALCGGKLVCGLSGNPASSITNYHLIALPALRKLCGCADWEHHWIPLTLAEDFPKPSTENRLLRGRLDLSDGTAKLVLSKARQGNIVIRSMIGCDAAAIIPAGSGPLPAGTQLQGFLPGQ